MKIIVPTELKDIKIKDYQKYLKIVEENPIEESIDVANFINIKLVEIMCHIKINDINAIKVHDFEDIIKTIGQTFEKKPKLQRHFTHKGVEFGFLPDLENISMGEYIDLTNYLSKIETIHKAMAVMYRPCKMYKNDMYTIEEYETAAKYEAVMKEVGLDLYLGSQVFFYSLGTQLVTHTLNSLDQTMMTSEQKKILAASGAGIAQFTQLLEGGWTNLTPSQN